MDPKQLALVLLFIAQIPCPSQDGALDAAPLSAVLDLITLVYFGQSV